MNKFEILDELIVYNPINNKIRLGRNYDGGYIIIDGYNYDFFISGGIGEDISFELDFHEKYSEVNGVSVDYTVDEPQNLPNNIKYVKKYISNINNDISTNLVEYVKKHKNVFLKLDIENGEWGLFNSEFIRYFCNVKQMVVELHNIFEENKNVINVLKKINETHYLTHVHENNHCRTQIKIGDYEYPDTLEFTYIRKDCDICGYNVNDLPIKNLDFPNSNHYQENGINFYPFNLRKNEKS